MIFMVVIQILTFGGNKNKVNGLDTLPCPSHSHSAILGLLDSRRKRRKTDDYLNKEYHSISTLFSLIGLSFPMYS